MSPLYQNLTRPDATGAQTGDTALPSPFCFLNPVVPWCHLATSLPPMTLVAIAEDI